MSAVRCDLWAGAGGLRRGLARPLRPRRRGRLRPAALGQNLGDPHQREFLAMTALAPRILAAALLEGDDLVAAHVIEDLGRNRCACNGRRADHRALAADREDLAELDDSAGLG